MCAENGIAKSECETESKIAILSCVRCDTGVPKIVSIQVTESRLLHRLSLSLSLFFVHVYHEQGFYHVNGCRFFLRFLNRQFLRRLRLEKPTCLCVSAAPLPHSSLASVYFVNSSRHTNALCTMHDFIHKFLCRVFLFA